MSEPIIYKNAAKLAHQRILELISERLNKLGSITSMEVWNICRGRTSLPYDTILKHLRSIMAEKIAAGEADFIRNGAWFIYRQNKL